jgi:hypothetical protein
MAVDLRGVDRLAAIPGMPPENLAPAPLQIRGSIRSSWSEVVGSPEELTSPAYPRWALVPWPCYSSSPSTTGPAAYLMRSSTARNACGSARPARDRKYCAVWEAAIFSAIATQTKSSNDVCWACATYCAACTRASGISKAYWLMNVASVETHLAVGPPLPTVCQERPYSPAEAVTLVGLCARPTLTR